MGTGHDRFILKPKDILKSKAMMLLNREAKSTASSSFEAEKKRILGLRVDEQKITESDRYKKIRNKEAHLDRPESILDAPGLRDDFYLNLLDWSPRNALSIALNETVYLYNYDKQETECVAKSQQLESYVTSIRSLREGEVLAIANNFGCISLVKTDSLKTVRNLSISSSVRIPAMANGGSLLWTGNGLGELAAFDHRSRKRLPVQVIEGGHSKEICGLEVAPEGEPYMASGANDNRVCIWDLRSIRSPVHVQEDHEAAVKALAWCPWQRHLLATGAGTADKRIRFWSAISGACLRTIKGDSQVCAILWSKTYSEIVSAHGYSSNALSIWHYPSLMNISSRQAHEARILHAVMSPDGTIVATTAANDSIKFWNLYPSRPFLRRPLDKKFL